jgi:hypothetical protein
MRRYRCDIQNVVALPEGVGVDGAGPEVDVGVLAGGLAGGAAVEVPDGQCVDVPLLAIIAGLESLQGESAFRELHLRLIAGLGRTYASLGAGVALGVDPDVFRDHNAALVELCVLVDLRIAAGQWLCPV